MKRASSRTQLPEGPVATTYATAELVRARTNPSQVLLLLNGVESSSLDLADPEYLDFEYMQHIRLILESRWDQGERRGQDERRAVEAGVEAGRAAEGRVSRRTRVLHLGGAGCALAGALGARRELHQVAVEIDPELARLVREWFPLPRSPFLKIRVGDARHVLDSTKANWNAIVRDAFTGREVPAHLRTAESAKRAADILEPGGIYVLNAVASAGIRRLDEDVAAMAAAFPNIVAIADPAVFSGKRFGNFVVAGSDARFPVEAIEREVRKFPLPTKFFDDGALRSRAASVRPLTDSLAGWPRATSPRQRRPRSMPTASAQPE